MARPRSVTTSTARIPSVNALEARSRPASAARPRCSPRPGSWPPRCCCGRWSPPAPRSSARPTPTSSPTSRRGRHQRPGPVPHRRRRPWPARRRPGPRRAAARRLPQHRGGRDLGRGDHQPRRRGVHGLDRLGAARGRRRAWGAAARRRRPDLERPGRHRRGSGGGRTHLHRLQRVPVEGARRPGRLAGGRGRRGHRRGPRWRRRFGGAMRQAGVLAAAGPTPSSTTASGSPRTTPTPVPSRATLAAAHPGLLDPTEVSTNIVYVPTGDRPASCGDRRPGRRASGSARWARTCCGSSPTSTSSAAQCRRAAELLAAGR
jgi:hypothetical protein